VRDALVTVANLLLPGSAQVARDEFTRGVALAVVFSVSLAEAFLLLALAPAPGGRGPVVLLFAAAFSLWLYSQLRYVRALRTSRGPDGGPQEEALAEVARLWLRGERAGALARLEPMLRRQPRDPALHFVAAQLWGEGTDGESQGRAQESLQLCRACDLEGRWKRAAERELSRLRAEALRRAEASFPAWRDPRPPADGR
jgi:hypothetical protein